jgi:predicted aspartyl protease
LDKGGHPTVKISVHGIHPDLAVEFDAMIDTGFTGFLMMSIVPAFPLGLTLLGSSSYTLADGSNSPKLTAYGTVTCQGESVGGVIVLEPNQCGLLLGMDFLRQARRALVVSEKGVLLIDEKIVAAGVEKIRRDTEEGKFNSAPSDQAS